MNLIISEIDEDDLVVCSSLYVETFREPPWKEEWDINDVFTRLSNFLACPGTIAIKIESSRDILGFLIGEIQQWSGSTFYFLKEICVHNSFQRKGIGRKLMHALEEKLKPCNVSAIYLITKRESIPSRFYTSLDFSENQNLSVTGKQIYKNS